MSQNMNGVGGGLRNPINANATTTVTASSVTGNTAFVYGGGVYVSAGTDTTVSGNTPDNCVGIVGC